MSEQDYADQWPESLRIMREQRERISELEAEVERLRGFVGDEDFTSDYQTAGDMRREIERLRARSVSCCFCDEPCGTLTALEKHSETCRLHPAVKEVERLTAEVNRLNLLCEATNEYGLAESKSAEAEIERLTEARDKLQRFKDWVHAYLDSKGVPHHPPGTHGAEGCRIGDRMDYVFAEVERLEGELKPFQPMTAAEAEAALDAVESVPLSNDEIKSAVRYATDVEYRAKWLENRNMELMRISRGLRAEVERLTSELTMLREFAGDEIIKSDYQTAGDMRREIEGLRPDAERYRWLREFYAWAATRGRTDVCPKTVSINDAEIDAARAAGGER